MCLGYSCTNLKANGAACGAGLECLSGNCTEGFCCGSASCGLCQSCAVPGKQGTCSPTADGTVCGASLCDGNDRYHAPSTCAAGMCVQGTRVDCAP